MQKIVTSNSSSDTACLEFKLPYMYNITTDCSACFQTIHF